MAKNHINTNTKDTEMSYDKTDALKYIDILQSCITRMANNSEKCKTWCITIVAALIALCLKGEQEKYSWLIFIPIFSLWFLDAFYLYLEQEFRLIYNNYIKAYDGVNIPASTYRISSASFKQCRCCKIFRLAWSISIFPFYGFLTLALVVAINHAYFSCLLKKIAHFFICG